MAMVMCMNQQINPTLLLDQQVIKAKIPLFNKALFKNGIEESSFIGREVMKVSFENDLYGRCYEGNAYAFCENNVTFLFIELWLKGNSSEFLSMWNTLEIKTCDHIEKEYTNIREEASQYLSSIKDLVKGDKVDDNLYAQDIILADNENRLIYSYKISNVRRSDFKEEELSKMREVGMNPLLKT